MAMTEPPHPQDVLRIRLECRQVTSHCKAGPSCCDKGIQEVEMQGWGELMLAAREVLR